jgi:hypothetical protein
MKKFMVFQCLIVLGLIMLMAGPVKKADLSDMNITFIDIEKQGYFNYHGQVSRTIERGEERIWVCNAPFTVYFGIESPIVTNSKGIPIPWGSTTRGIQSRPFDGSKQGEYSEKLTKLNDLLEKPPKDLCKMKIARFKSSRDKLKLALDKVKSGRYFIASAWVSHNALSGKYKYIIAVYMNGKVWVDDPEDIIDPPPR